MFETVVSNRVFVDDDLRPWADQWVFLATVRKIRRSDVEYIVQDAERRGRAIGVRLPRQDDGDDEPWTAPPSRTRPGRLFGQLPKSLEFVLGKQICIAKGASGLRNRLLRLVAFPESGVLQGDHAVVYLGQPTGQVGRVSTRRYGS